MFPFPPAPGRLDPAQMDCASLRAAAAHAVETFRDFGNALDGLKDAIFIAAKSLGDREPGPLLREMQRQLSGYNLAMPDGLAVTFLHDTIVAATHQFKETSSKERT